MSIQVSVLIWTMICFFVLMLVLDKLLFRPLLAFMDARREKIDRAREKREAAEQAHDEALRLTESARTEAEKTARHEAEAAIAEAKRAAAAEISAKKKEYDRLLAEAEANADAESLAVRQALSAGRDELARALADRLAS